MEMLHSKRPGDVSGYRSTATNATVSRPTVKTIRSNTSHDVRGPDVRKERQPRGRSVTVSETTFRSTNPRPSALPRSTSGSSSAKLDALASSRPIPMLNRPSGSSSKPNTSMLEDVPLIFDTGYRDRIQPVASAATPTTRSSLDMDQDSIFGVAFPEKRSYKKPTHLPDRLIPELQALAAISTKVHPPPQTSASTISSPSTRYTESPGPWSASTANTTPVSWSSASPGLVQSTASGSLGKRSKTVPIPASARKRLPRLPELQESSGSMNTRIPTQIQSTSQIPRGLSKSKNPVTPAPTPPPRTSSAKKSHSRSGSKSNDSQKYETSMRVSPQRSEINVSPLAGRTNMNVIQVGDSLRRTDLGHVHNDLQQSIAVTSSRSTRQGTVTSGEDRTLLGTTHRARSTSQRRRLLDSALEDEPHKVTVRSRDTSVGTQGSQRSATDSSVATSRSPGPFTKLSRLGFFGRHAKQSQSDVERSPRKLQRKGPAAGTGHEGYGKYAKRGRKVSLESSSAKSDSERSISSTRRIPVSGSSRKDSHGSSRHNRSSQSDLDEFAASRMKPVVMRGGSQSQDAIHQLPPTPNLQTLSPNLSTTRSLTATPLSDVDSTVRDRRQSQSPERPATTSQLSGLALRRSQRFGPGIENVKLPTLLRSDVPVAPIYVNSYDTSQSSIYLPSSTPSELNNEKQREYPPTIKDKKNRKLKWNPFRRRQPTPEREQTRITPMLPQSELPVHIAAGSMQRSVPYYAMMESESENNTTEMIGEFLTEAAMSPIPSPEIGPRIQSGEERMQRNYRESVLLPTPAVFPQQYYDRSLQPIDGNSAHQPAEIQPTAPKIETRQPRLAQVGRIPKVVSRSERQHSERQHKPSRSSFSQPFSRLAPRLWEEEGRQITDSNQSNQRPVLEIHTDVLPSRPTFVEYDITKPASAPVRPYGQIIGNEQEFLRFGSIHGSEVSASTSSDGVVSLLSTAMAQKEPPLGMTLEMPQEQGEDEIWNEYDDFIDHVMSPSKSKKQTRGLEYHKSSRAADVQSEGTETEGMKASRNMLGVPLPPIQTSFTPSINSSSPSLRSERSRPEELRLRRSRIVSALHSSIDPSSPFSMREFLREYGDRPSIGDKFAEHFNTSNTGRFDNGLMETVSSPLIPESTKSTPDRNQRDNARLLDVVERNKNPAAQSELHYASLMVARWLSFGRVLFSPAHEEINTLPNRQILVIDGLGSEDWSIYCAVTYEPQKALVHDLREKSAVGSQGASRTSFYRPPNHQQVEVSSLADRFPFTDSYFSAIVLRFPPAMSEAKMTNIISECRRTLMPGGHLELMILDIDIVNMGVDTRRAVRGLKMRMTTAQSNVSLKPIIDNVQSILGSRNFSSLNRCVVGVPVVSRPSGSIDSSSSSRSSAGSDSHQKRGMMESRYAARKRISPEKYGTSFSLNDLVADHSENADAKIGRMVSRTARSWWQHCFETAVIQDGDLKRSIFSEKRILQECKARGSSFKLLIAYAQRPVFETRRRTMSEPTIATLATAGTSKSSKKSAH